MYRCNVSNTYYNNNITLQEVWRFDMLNNDNSGISAVSETHSPRWRVKTPFSFTLSLTYDCAYVNVYIYIYISIIYIYIYIYIYINAESARAASADICMMMMMMMMIIVITGSPVELGTRCLYSCCAPPLNRGDY